MEEQFWAHRPKKQRQLLKASLKIFVLVLLLGGVFFAGLNIGNGTIRFSETPPQASENNLPSDLNYNSVERVYDLLREGYDGELDEAKLIEGLKKGLVEASGDPYTEYLNSEQTKDLDEDLSGTFSGIGAELGKDGDNVVIVSPIKGFPAEAAGLQAKDIVTKINDDSAFGMSITDAVSKIRGPVGSEVTLTLVRDGKEQVVTIKREQITIPSVDYKILENNIGYIRISRFSDDTASLSEKAAASFKEANVKGVILDVRNNPGGLLNSAVEVSSLWLPSNKVVLEERRGGVTIKEFNALGDPILEGVPTVVLINGGSASASEIVAGALSDNGAATLLGEKTYGKGSVQQIERLPDNNALKVTIARWYTPGGLNIDKQGIEPSQKVEQKNTGKNDTTDEQLDAAKKSL